MKNKDLAIQLKDNWVKNNIIQPDATYNEAANNSELMKTLLLHLGLGLSKKAEKSRYGNKLISKFDLYFQCQTDEALNAKLKALNMLIYHMNKELNWAKK